MGFPKQLEYTLKKITTSLLRLFFKQPQVKPAPPFHRILFIRYGHIGDMILSLPVFRAARTRNPDAQIDMLCDVMNAGLLKNYKPINNAYFYEKGFTKIIRLLRRLRKIKYDNLSNL